MIDTNEMLLIHRVLRREVGALPELIRRANNDPARARIVGPHAVEMLDFLHVHHSGEDELLWPVLRPRVAVEGDLLDRMEAQHHQVAAAIADVERDLPGWTTSADPVTGERIATRLGEMNTVLTEHLAEEEKQILPLVAANFSQAEWDALVYDAATMRLPVIGADSKLFKVLERACQKILGPTPRKRDIQHDVRELVIEGLAKGAVQFDAVARELNMSSKTLERRLAERKTTFSALLDDARSGLAKHYLTDTDLRLEQITYLTGYSEPAALVRAFRRWTGTTPMQFRAKCQ